MSHVCHANLCVTPCRPEHLMCPRHWAMVPADVQQEVLHHYRPGQCNDMRPSPEWFAAAKLAVALVAQREGKPTSRAQRELLAALAN
jgi:hypothetical protein